MPPLLLEGIHQSAERTGRSPDLSCSEAQTVPAGGNTEYALLQLVTVHTTYVLICSLYLSMLTSGTEKRVSRRSKYFPPVSLLSRRLSSDLAVPGGPNSSRCSPASAASSSSLTCPTQCQSQHCKGTQNQGYQKVVLYLSPPFKQAVLQPQDALLYFCSQTVWLSSLVVNYSLRQSCCQQRSLLLVHAPEDVRSDMISVPKVVNSYQV